MNVLIFSPDLITLVFKDHIVTVRYTLLPLLGISYTCSIVLASENLANFTDKNNRNFPRNPNFFKPPVLQSSAIFTGITHALEIRHEINSQCSLIYSVVQLQSLKER